MNNLVSELECPQMTLFQVDNFIRKNIDKKFKVLGIFLDVQKAFGYVNHDIL